MRRLIVGSKPEWIMDVGAGPGKWGRILKGVAAERIDAIEVWQPYIEKYELAKIYNRVYCLDARLFHEWHFYDVIIMGDVLEHMPKDDARLMVERMLGEHPIVCLSIPVTNCPQEGEPFGNPYEAHVAQWSHEELLADGWHELHRGLVPSGLATVGTYWQE